LKGKRQVEQARFLAAALSASEMPPEGPPEIAFAGRSNVGKSSLINTLVGKKIARISAEPGRTRTINFYAAAGLVLVDLPGYGYAKVAQKLRRLWQPAVEGYLTGRRSLRGVVCVVDVRRGLEAEEIDLLAWLAHHRLPFCLVLTKADKLKGNERHRAVAAVAAEASADPVVFSARTGEGREFLWRLVREMVVSHDGLMPPR
jgi:GTP-binding protein